MGRKWANIVAKKTAKDGATSKIYAKFGVEIYAAAKQGEPDPELNTSLKFVIERAKAGTSSRVIDKTRLIKPKAVEMKRSYRDVMSFSLMAQ